MSNIDLEKDELATQEMMAMLDEENQQEDQTSEQSASEDLDVDDLLGSLDALEKESETEETESVDDSGLDTDMDMITEDPVDEITNELNDIELPDSPEASEEAATDMEQMSAELELPEPTSIETKEFDHELDEKLHDDLLNDQADNAPETAETEINDDLDDIMSEVSEETPSTEAGLEEAVSEETLDLDLDLDVATASESDTLETDPLSEANQTEETPDLTDNLDAMDPVSMAGTVEESIEELSSTEMAEEITPVEETAEFEPPASDTSSENELQQALTVMMEAIEMNKQMQQYAQQLDATSVKASQVALATAQKAQAAALETQKKLEANFAAAEKAFDTAQSAGYSVSDEEIEKFSEPSQMDQYLAEIQEKNRSLHEANEQIAQRLASIQKS